MKTSPLFLLTIMVGSMLLAAPGRGLVTEGRPPGQAAATSAPATTKLVSVASDGSQGNAWSQFPSISADGRYVAFVSAASNLVDGDTNIFCYLEGDYRSNCPDVFVHDWQTGSTTRVSVASDGGQGNDESFSAASISADGRFVAFSSLATTLVGDDTNDVGDSFLHDRKIGTTERVSISSIGSQGNGESYFPSLSFDGRYVAFQSDANNLVDGDTNNSTDIFVRDRQTGITELVSYSNDGSQGNGASRWPSISADGRFVAFYSESNNLVPGDGNGVADIYLRDLRGGSTELISVSSDGTPGDGASVPGSISANGRFVAFESAAGNLVPWDTNHENDIFVRDRLTGLTTRVSVASDGSQGDLGSNGPSLSADGRFVAFESWATNFTDGDTNHLPDIYVHDRMTGVTRRVSLGDQDQQGDRWATRPAISGDGRRVAFDSASGNLVPGDTNDKTDVFLRDQGEGFGRFLYFFPFIRHQGEYGPGW